MGKNYIRILTVIFLALGLFLGHPEVSGMSHPADTTVKATAAKQQNLQEKPSPVKSGSLKASFIRLFSPSLRSPKISDNDKLLSRVKVFPNPISDQINLSFNLGKDNQVSIKVMDALGNEVTTLLSQRLPGGEQNHSFSINNKLSSGYYFIRVVAGTETVIKRISVL